MLSKSALLRTHFTGLNFLALQRLFIQTQTTPNPNFMKFMPGQTVMKDGTMDFVSSRYTHASPLARKLFMVDGVQRVFYGKDYISIAKRDDAEWRTLKPQIFECMMQQFTSDQPLFTDAPEPEDTKISDNDSEVIKLIKEILETRVRPNVQEDGGDIVFRNFDEKTGIVHLYLKGSCSGCPSSSVTLKQGIEKMLMHYISEVNGCEATDYPGAEAASTSA